MKNWPILFFLIALPSMLLGNNYYFFQDVTQNYNLSNVAIHTVCEDENGFVWFGSDNGLYFHNTIAIEKVQLHKDFNTIGVNKIYKDSYNNLWVCTEHGLFKHNKKENKFEHKKVFFENKKQLRLNRQDNFLQLKQHSYLVNTNSTLLIYNEKDSSLQPIKTDIRGNISFLHKDRNEIIYIGTHDGRIYISKDSLKHIKLLCQSTKGRASAICKDGNNYYIGYPNDGVEVINANGVIINELNNKLEGDRYLKNNLIRGIIKRKNGELWIVSHIGIIVLHKGKQTLLDSGFETGLPHRTVFSIYEGRNDNMWLGTYSGGLAYYSDYNYIFKSVAIDYGQKHVVRSDVSSFCEDTRGYIWVGSDDEGGIKVFDPSTNDFIVEPNPELSDSIKGVRAVVAIDDNLVAIGKAFSNKISIYNYDTHTFETPITFHIKVNLGITKTKYFDDKLWIVNRLTLISYDTQTKQYKKVFRSPFRISQLYFDSSNNLWISTEKGLYLKTAGASEVQECKLSNSPIDLRKLWIYSVCEDKEGRIWVGTMGNGLYIYTPENETVELAPDHLLTAGDDIYSLIKDQQNNIWYNTNLGLYRYDVANKHTDYYGANDGINNKRTRPNAAFCSQSGILYFGTKNGFNIINPKKINKNPYAPTVFLAGFTINNSPYYSQAGTLFNSTGFIQLKKITLNSEQNTLGFKVVCNNYIKSEKNSFKYRLSNYDNKWIEVPQNKEIVFAKVPPGTYLFEAYGSNNDKVWSTQPYSLEITILPPYYWRWYAILLYVAVAIVLGTLLYKDLKTKVKLRKEITKERYKSQAKELIHSERIKFFTNISHEFRTPLSLVLSPIQSLLKNGTYDEQTKHLLKIADRNAKRLLKIADQSIDFRLLEIGKLQANFERHDIVQVAKEVYLCFEQQIVDRQINFTFTSEFQRLEITIDGDMVEKIIYNLLSNALKYTPEKENVSLLISKSNFSENDYSNKICTGNKFIGEAVSITVKDTGRGIKSNLLPHIFERYTKGSESHQKSTGIGLHLCKEYSEMNKGNMLLTSEEGKGASFALNLPLATDTKYETGMVKQLVNKNSAEKEDVSKIISLEKSKKYTLLIVEDNDELRRFLKTLLVQYFKVITARSGDEALNVLVDLTPDLIITDVSMPGISGIDLTRQLKKDHNKRQIPVLVMTAYVDRKYQMESILCGADAFFTKPIDEALLLAQINNILEKRKWTAKAETQKAQSTEDNSFIDKIKQIVEANLQNPDFEIPDLLNVLNISKSTLSRKIKAETQLNPSAFIRDIRLNNAAKLIHSKKFNIDEIATYVGFNSTSYFIRTFKAKYGVTPNEYRKK